MSDDLIKAQPPLEFIPPAFNPWVLQLARTMLPAWLHLKTNLTNIQGSNVENLVKLYERFQKGNLRFLMAFRHPNTNDPFCLAHLLWKLVPLSAKETGINLQSPIHAHFMYDRGIPLWAGETVGWLYSQLGGTSIQRGKLDLMGLKSARDILANGKFPLAAAPEGATNGHNEIMSPAEPGIAQLGFWCIEDLKKAGRKEEVAILPIGIQYYYLTPPWQELEQLLTQLEIDTGLSTPQRINAVPSESFPELYQRLYRLGEHLLSVMEDFYRDYYHQELPQVLPSEANESNGNLSTRLQNLLDVALKVAEAYFNLTPKGSYIERCRRLEQAGWERIYREDFKQSTNLSNIDIGLANRVAEEASLRVWHMRLVESFVAVTGYYVKEKPTAERFAETALLIWDLVARIKGENSFFRPHLGKQRVQITVGEPISISDRALDYQNNRRQAVAILTQDLQAALENLIVV